MHRTNIVDWGVVESVESSEERQVTLHKSE